jgi:hypothetical protein
MQSTVLKFHPSNKPSVCIFLRESLVDNLNEISVRKKKNLSTFKSDSKSRKPQ